MNWLIFLVPGAFLALVIITQWSFIRRMMPHGIPAPRRLQGLRMPIAPTIWAVGTAAFVVTFAYLLALVFQPHTTQDQSASNGRPLWLDMAVYSMMGLSPVIAIWLMLAYAGAVLMWFRRHKRRIIGSGLAVVVCAMLYWLGLVDLGALWTWVVGLLPQHVLDWEAPFGLPSWTQAILLWIVVVLVLLWWLRIRYTIAIHVLVLACWLAYTYRGDLRDTWLRIYQQLPELSSWLPDQSTPDAAPPRAAPETPSPPAAPPSAQPPKAGKQRSIDEWKMYTTRDLAPAGTWASAVPSNGWCYSARPYSPAPRDRVTFMMPSQGGNGMAEVQPLVGDGKMLILFTSASRLHSVHFWAFHYPRDADGGCPQPPQLPYPQ